MINEGITVRGFVKFVKDQPRDKIINHISWNTCAVGQYVDSLNASHHLRRDRNYDIHTLLQQAKLIVVEHKSKHPNVQHTVRDTLYHYLVCANEINSKTYGMLADVLDTHS